MSVQKPKPTEKQITYAKSLGFKYEGYDFCFSKNFSIYDFENASEINEELLTVNYPEYWIDSFMDSSNTPSA